MTKKQIAKLAQLIDAKYGDAKFFMQPAEERQQELGDLILAFTPGHNRSVQYLKYRKRITHRRIRLGRTATVTPAKGD